MTNEELAQIESSERQVNENREHYEKQCLIVEQADYNLFALLKPEISKDGNKWCVLYGENRQE